MNKLVLKEIINTNDNNLIPKIFPNNLSLIKENFGLSAQDIANILSLNVNFINNVINEKVNFSSLSVIKLIKELNIPFSLIYNVKRNIETPAYCNPKIMCIYQVDKKNSEIEDIDIITNAIKEIDLSSISKNKIVKLFKKINNKNITYTIDEIEENLLEDLHKCSELASTINYDFNNYEYYCILIEYISSSNIMLKKYLDLHENYDSELIKYLYSLPFEEIKMKKESISIFKVNYVDETNTYALPCKYKLFLNNEIIETDTISKDDCILIKKNEIIIPIASSENKLVKLKELRNFKNYTTKDMARILNISEKTYMNLENNYQRPSIAIMWKLEYYFGILLDCVINIDEFYKRYCN